MTETLASTSREAAAALDSADPLAPFRDRFVIDDAVAYFDANSLGRLPAGTPARLERVVRGEWGRELVRGWDHWLALPLEVGDRLAPLLGASTGEVALADSTTVNFYRLLVGALDARRERRAIVTDRPNFPTDRYVIEGLAAARGLEIRWLEPDPIEGPTFADVAAVLDRDVAVVTLSHVNYRSAAIADLASITAAAHDVGALVVWDLSHAAGSIPVGLDENDVDLAVGCTYKYLNGGPGAPAFLVVAARLQAELRQPIWGWFGQRDQFAMGRGYDPPPDIRRFLVGTPGILGLAAADEGIRLSVEAGIDAIRAKGIALTEYAIALHDAWLAPRGTTLGSPRDPSRRGSHVAIRHPQARGLTAAMIASGVIPDFREPDSIRIGLSPLTTSFEEAWRGLSVLRELLESG
ncbi:MAG: kynureninase [Chloroflexota bacterium]